MTHSEQENTMSARLWEFVKKTYAQPGVADSCLRLQDCFDIDVSLLLFVSWYAANGGVLSKDQITALDEYCTAWRSRIIKPLREQRREWKGSDGPWYESAKSLEVEAERLMLAELEAHASREETLSDSGSSNDIGERLIANFQAFAAFMEAKPHSQPRVFTAEGQRELSALAALIGSTQNSFDLN